MRKKGKGDCLIKADLRIGPGNYVTHVNGNLGYRYSDDYIIRIARRSKEEGLIEIM
jgi:hypothetical protein